MRKSYLAVSIAAAAMLITSTSVLATNGYFAHGYSTKEKGLAGAGVAYSQDALASATNPAGLANVEQRLDVGIALFSPQREYEVNGPMYMLDPTAPQPNPAFSLVPGNYSSDNNAFAIPSFGINWKLDDNNAIGLAAYGNGGMNTEYNGVPNPAPGMLPDGGTYYGGTAGVDLMQLFVNATYATKINKQNAIGISAIGVAQSFEAKGLSMFGMQGMSTSPTNLTNNGKDRSYGIGAKIGWQGDVNDSFTIGASYQTKINMSAFDDYSGLFANGGDFDIPATATVGIAVNTSPTTVLVLDVQRIYYSNVDSIGNAMLPNLMNPDGSGRLGGTNGAGFGWEDMTIVKVGYEFGSSNRYRVGASYGENPIPDSEVMFNILAPAVMQTHLTAGATFPFGEASEFNIAGMYAPSYTVSGANPMDPGQTIDLTMEQYEVQIGYALGF